MRLLLDTHHCYWLVVEPGKLTPSERRTIDRSNALAFSAASIWELRLKWGRRFVSGERKGPVDPADLLEALTIRGLRVLTVTPHIAAATLRHPLDHSDPFDELLLTQAQEEGYRLLTRDEKLASHPLALVA